MKRVFMGRSRQIFLSFAVFALLSMPAWAGEFPLAERIPSGTMVYLGWAGQNEAFDASLFGQMVQDPAAGALVNQVRTLMVRMGGPQALPMVNTVLSAGNVLWRHPFAVALIDLQPPPASATSSASRPGANDSPTVSAVFIADPGADRETFNRCLTTLTAAIPPDLKQRDGAFVKIPSANLCYGYIGQTFILAVGDKTIAAIRDLPAEKSLLADATFIQAMTEVGAMKAKGKVVAKQAQLAFYADTARLGAALDTIFKNLPGEHDISSSFAQSFRNAGLDKVTTLAASMRVVDAGMYSRVRITTPAPHRGLLGLFVSKRLTENDIARIPADVYAATMITFPLSQAVDVISPILTDPTAEGLADIQKAIRAAEKETKISIQEDLLSRIGDTWFFYTLPNSDGLAGMIVMTDVKEPKKFAAAATKLEEYLNRSDDRLFEFTSTPMGNLVVHQMEWTASPDLPPMLANLKPCWCISGNKIFIGFAPAALAAATQPMMTHLTQNKDFLAVRAHLTGPASYLSYASSQASWSPFSVANANVPPEFQNLVTQATTLLAKYRQPETESFWADDKGITMQNYGSYPALVGGPLTVATGVTLLLPSLNQARQIAKQAATSMNLSMIGKGLLLYSQDNDGRLPPDLQTLVTTGNLAPNALVSPLKGKGYTYIRFIKAPAMPAIVAYDDLSKFRDRRIPVLLSDGTVQPIDRDSLAAAIENSVALAKKEGGGAVPPTTAPANDFSPEQVQSLAIKLLSAGKQPQAEALLKSYVSPYKYNQRIVFLHACCLRSRFFVPEAFSYFRAVAEMNPDSTEGQAAIHIMCLDTRRDAEKHFAALRNLADQHPVDPMLRWMIAVQCRAFNKNAEGVEHYKKLLEMWNPGPALLHQTYGNLLDELERYDEALVERRKTVELSHAAFAYQGLANTLAAMERFDEANEAYEKTVELEPENSTYWRSWAWGLSHQKKWDEAIVKAQKALELNPREWRALNTWGYCLENKGQYKQALEKYREVLKINPNHEHTQRRIRWIEQQTTDNQLKINEEP